jgi:phosphate transport system substrate-binding protein
MKISKSLKIAVAALALSIFAVQPAMAVGLTGAGATFPQPLIDICKAGFAADTGHSFTYGGGGSGTGRGNSDKGVGDVNFSDTSHTASTRVASVIHIPVVAAPVAVMYNLPNKSKGLNLSANTVAGIFAGTITKWNDPAIVADNNRSITTVVYRSDASGTQGNFTNFLAGAAPTIWTKAGNNAFASTFPGDLNAPANLGRITGASGSSGVAVQAGKTPYSITFAEKNFAKAQGLGVANIGNAAGNFQAPDAAGTSAFLGAATQDANGFLVFNYKSTIAGAYPLGIVSYALVDTKTTNAAAVKSLLNYILSPKCVNTDPSLEYSVITGSLLAFNQKQIAKIGA